MIDCAPILNPVAKLLVLLQKCLVGGVPLNSKNWRAGMGLVLKNFD